MGRFRALRAKKSCNWNLPSSHQNPANRPCKAVVRKALVTTITMNMTRSPFVSETTLHRSDIKTANFVPTGS